MGNDSDGLATAGCYWVIKGLCDPSFELGTYATGDLSAAEQV